MKAKDLKNSILQYAIQGKLVPQDLHDEPASELLKKIEKERQELIKKGVIKKNKELKPVEDEEKPFDLPNGWEWVRLGEIGFCQTGTTPPKDTKKFYGCKYPFIKPDNITEGNFINNNIKEFLSEEGMKYSGRFIKRNSILMVCIGSIGKTAITNFDCSCNQQINCITCFKNINNKFVFYCMISQYFKVEALKMSSKTTLPILNKNNWEKILIPLPPLAEQERIVKKIEEIEPYIKLYDKYETRLSEINKNFPTDIKNSILQYAIQGKLVPQDPHDEPASELLKKIEKERQGLIKQGIIKKNKELKSISDEEKPFDLPKGWEWVRFEEIIINLSIKNFQIKESDILKNGLYPVVSQSQKLIDGYFNNNKKLLIHNRPLLIFGDHTKCLKYIDFNFIVGADGVKVLFSLNKNVKYIYLVIKYFIINMCDRGYNRHYKILKNLLLPLPPLAEQERIVKKVDELMKVVDRCLLVNRLK